MIDMHHHLLYGIDDGPEGFEAAARMADSAWQDGARTIIATPHAYPGLRPFDWERFQEGLDSLNSYCAAQGYDLAILPGAEIRDSESAVRLLDEGRIPTMNGTGFVLVEWSHRVDFDAMFRSVREYANAGYRVIVAHMERYPKLWLRKDAAAVLRQTFDARIQLDCEALLDKGPFLMRRFVREMLKNDQVDYVASDAHDTAGRRTRMTQARGWLQEQYGEERAHALTQGNQEELYG